MGLANGGRLQLAMLMLQMQLLATIAAPVTDSTASTVGFTASLNELGKPTIALLPSLPATDAADTSDETVVARTDDGHLIITTRAQLATAGGGGGNSGRGVISDIAKVVKIAEILGTVGETVIPALVEAATQASTDAASAVASATGLVDGGGSGGGGGSSGRHPIGVRLFNALRPQEGGGGGGDDGAVKMPAA